VRKSFLHDIFLKKALALAQTCGIITADHSQKALAFG